MDHKKNRAPITLAQAKAKTAANPETGAASRVQSRESKEGSDVSNIVYCSEEHKCIKSSSSRVGPAWVAAGDVSANAESWRKHTTLPVALLEESDGHAIHAL